MDRLLNASTVESSPADSRLWIGRFVIAVVLGEAIWGFLVSITNNLALPAMARAMSGDTQSPLSLGKGDFNIPGLFASTLELCFAAIVALLVNSWSQKRRRIQAIRTRTVPTEPQPAHIPVVEPPPPAQVVVPSAPSPAVPAKAATASQTSGTTASSTPAPPAAAAEPTKPKKQKAVYYNIVGEPVDPDE